MTNGYIIEPMNTSQQIESFNKMANNYRCWEWSATELLASANILKREREKEISRREREMQSGKAPAFPYTYPPESFTEEVEWMLHAFALECLLKGLFVKSGGKIAENGKYKGVVIVKEGKVKDHDLENLAKHVIGNISEEHQKALRKLGLIGMTVGRYPIALRYDKLAFSNEENTIGYDLSSVLLTNGEQSFIGSFTRELLKELREQVG